MDMPEPVMDTTKLDRQNINIFSDVTTYGKDYTEPSHICRSRPVNKEIVEPESLEKPVKPQEFVDIETFFKFDPRHYLPFDLLWKAKDIVDTYPTQTFENPYASKGEKPIDPVVATRPRVILTPAVPIDDLEPEKRKQVLNAVYQSTWNARGQPGPTQDTGYRCRQWYRENVNCCRERPGGDRIKKKVKVVPPLRLGWHKFADTWDALQTRAVIDSNRQFWLHKDPPVKGATEVISQLKDPERSKKIDHLVRTDTLRAAYDLQIPGYQGHIPMLAAGVPLEKTKFMEHEQFVTTTELMYRDIESQFAKTVYADILKKD